MIGGGTEGDSQQLSRCDARASMSRCWSEHVSCASWRRGVQGGHHLLLRREIHEGNHQQNVTKSRESWLSTRRWESRETSRN